MRLRWWGLASVLLAGASFFSLYYIYTNVEPTPNIIFAGPQLLFLLLMFLGVSAGTVPVAAYMNYRFARPGWIQRDKIRLLRQGSWVGLFTMLLAYLQLIRALNWTIALVLASVFVLIEVFYLTRE